MCQSRIITFLNLTIFRLKSLFIHVQNKKTEEIIFYKNLAMIRHQYRNKNIFKISKLLIIMRLI